MKQYVTRGLATILGLTMAGAAFGHDCSEEAPTGAHDAASFGHTDTDRDGWVTLGEARAAAQLRFDRFDQNRDGLVSREEAIVGAKLWRQERFEARFATLDHDRDGLLSREESQLPARRFEQLDRNGDQRLTRGELKLAFSLQPGADGGAAAASGRFARWDENRDGRITRAEAQQAADRRFAREDRNGDGVLTPDEGLSTRSPPR